MGNELQTFSAEYWREQAQQVAKSEPLGVMPGLSVRAGMLLYEGEPVIGNQALAIVLDTFRVNTFYPNAYDPDVPSSPTCYAISRDGDQMAPHPTMQADLTYFSPQNVQCVGCLKNEFGSKGKGKACQNRRRLYMIAAGRMDGEQWKVFDTAKYYEAADVVQMSLPVTSVKAWGEYVHKLSTTVQRPFFGVATRISVSPHPKHQFHINFDLFANLPDELAGVVIARRNHLLAQPVVGFSPPQKEEAAPF